MIVLNPTDGDVRKALANRTERRDLIHRQKFRGGRCTPEEFHQRYAFPRNAHCYTCTRRPLVTARTFLPLAELVKVDPEGVAAALMTEAGEKALRQRCVMFKQASGNAEPFVMVAMLYACKEHQKELEVAAATAPSYAVVEINRGPGRDRIISGPGGMPSAITHG